MGSPLPNTPQIITSIVYQLSKIHPPQPPPPPASAAAAPPDRNNNSTQRQNHNPSSTETNNNNNPFAQLPGPVLSKVKPLLLTLHCLFPNELLLALDILDRKGVERYEYDDDDDVYDRERGVGEAEQQQYRRGENIDRGIYLVHSSSSSSSGAVAPMSAFLSSSSGMNTTRPNANNANNHPPKTKTHHLVCLNAWHCSCPAFTMAAFRDLDSDSPGPTTATTAPTTRTTAELEIRDHNEGEEDGRNNNNPPSTSTSTPAPPFPFGGTLTKDSMKNTMHHSTPVCKHLLACLLGSQCPALFGHGVERVYVGGNDDGGGGGPERQQAEVMAGRFALV